MGRHFFFYVLGEKSPARVAKVPAAILNPAISQNIQACLKATMELFTQVCSSPSPSMLSETALVFQVFFINIREKVQGQGTES